MHAQFKFTLIKKLSTIWYDTKNNNSLEECELTDDKISVIDI